ncbi:MAG: carbohydrate ABC transporter permease [Lachnospirales bacterium]
MKKYNLPNFIISTFILFFVLSCVIPILLVLSISLTEQAAINQYGFRLIPPQFSTRAYELLFATSSIYRSYGVSIFTTVIGTFLAVLITIMCAYTLNNKKVAFRNYFSMFFLFSMLFTTGLVPWYFMCQTLGLVDNILALIIPTMLFNPFNMYLAKNYIKSVPDSLMESAKIDGANDFIILFKIYLPLCKPVIATLILFYGLGYWNNWMNAIMLVDTPTLYPLQFILYKMQSDIAMMTQIQGNTSLANLPTDSLKMATVIITIGPIILLYPFLQKYFIKGLTIGAVKG